MNSLQILYEDNHIIVVVKPPGILSQSDQSGADDMLSMIKAMIKVRDQKKGDVYLGLVHRLDRPVGGVMVFAKTSKAASRLSDQVRIRDIHKKYYAVVLGHLTDQSARLEHYLYKIQSQNRVKVYTLEADHPNQAKYAALDYAVLGHAEWNNQPVSLVEVQLLTGRSHQIRAQFAAIGHPLCCDRKYGPSYHKLALALDGPALWSFSYGFTHPTKRIPMVFEAVPPICKPWSLFDAIHDLDITNNH